MRCTLVFVGLSAFVVIANGQQQQGNEQVVDAIAQSKDIVSDQEVLFPASLLNNAQLQSIEAQLQHPANSLPAIPQEYQDKKQNNQDQSDDNEDDGDEGDEDEDEEEDDDDGAEVAQDWMNEADKSLTNDLIQKQNHILTTSWSVSGSSSYPIVIDTDFIFNPITLAPESSRTGATTTATATPAVRNKKKVRPASNAASSYTLTSVSMVIPLVVLSASHLFHWYI